MTGILQALLSFFGVSGSSSANYIEDVFSTYLYTGNEATLNIVNNIDISGKGGLVWLKGRVSNNGATLQNELFDTNRGAQYELFSNLTNAQQLDTDTLTSFNSNGFSLGADATTNGLNNPCVSWTFREQAKFFDVVTYTGTGTARTIAHNLGSTPGCVIVKRTDSTGDWAVYHRGLTSASQNIYLNLTNAASTATSIWNSTAPTSTEFSVGTATVVNASGGTYVAYLFAHDAGGFGAAGTDNVITCGSYTGNGSATGPTITLNYEPQWILVKRAVGGTGNWNIIDNMRGFDVGANDATLAPNTTDAESVTTLVTPTSTGFQVATTNTAFNANGSTYIYIAIRRGPMKTPTSATTVFGLNARTGTGVNTTVTGGAGVTDLALIKSRTSANEGFWVPRLTGNKYLIPSSTSNETTATTLILQTNPWDVMDGVKVGTTGNASNDTGNTYINYLFDRAPGFMDVVCYTGTGSPTAVTHNLGVVPELIITKRRDSNYDWVVYSQTLGTTKVLFLNANDAETTFTGFGNVTSTNFDAVSVVQNGNQVAYLFATLSGISKVGSYTGTGTTQVINCGFTAGSRFVMIKRTDSIGDWYYWDSARGIVAGNDPYLLMNSAVAEVTSTDYIDTANSGFEISSTAPAAINANGGTFIFLAIA